MRLTRQHFRALADGLRCAQAVYGLKNKDEALGFAIAMQGIISVLKESNQNFNQEFFENYVKTGQEK